MSNTSNCNSRLQALTGYHRSADVIAERNNLSLKQQNASCAQMNGDKEPRDFRDSSAGKLSTFNTNNNNNNSTSQSRDLNSDSLFPGKSSCCGCPASEGHKALLHSENRRQLLLQKLKDAQETIRIQSQNAKETEIVSLERDSKIEQLQLGEEEYKRKLKIIETEMVTNRKTLWEKNEALEEHKRRNDKQLLEVNVLRSANTQLQDEIRQKTEQLSQNNTELTALKAERVKLVQLTEKLAAQLNASSHAEEASQARNEHLENLARISQRGLEQMKSENSRLMSQNASLQKQLNLVNNQLASQQSENSALITSIHCAKADKEQLVRQFTELQESLTDLKTTHAKTTEDKKWYFQEKLDLHQKLHSVNLAYEVLSREKLSLESQVDELTSELAQLKSVASSANDEKRNLNQELLAAKKVSEALNCEMDTLLARLEQQSLHLKSVEKVRDDTLQHCREYEQKIIQLESQLELIHKTQKDFEEAEKMKTVQCAAEMQSLKSKCDQSNSQLEQKQATIDTLNSQLDQLRHRSSTLEKTLEKKSDEFRNELDRVHLQTRNLEADKVETASANKKLATDVQTLQKTVEMFQLIHQEDARLVTELKKERDAAQWREKNTDQTHSSETATLLQKVGELESELEHSRQTLQKQEALIYALRKPLNEENEGVAGRPRDRDEMQATVKENDMIQRENKELREMIMSLTKELQIVKCQHDETMEEMRRLDQEQQEKSIERFRRELLARDRQIESLEEQLARFNDSSLRRMRRECSKVDLLSAQNRRLQTRLDEFQTAIKFSAEHPQSAGDETGIQRTTSDAVEQFNEHRTQHDDSSSNNNNNNNNTNNFQRTTVFQNNSQDSVNHLTTNNNAEFVTESPLSNTSQYQSASQSCRNSDDTQINNDETTCSHPAQHVQNFPDICSETVAHNSSITAVTRQTVDLPFNGSTTQRKVNSIRVDDDLVAGAPQAKLVFGCKNDPSVVGLSSVCSKYVDRFCEPFAPECNDTVDINVTQSSAGLRTDTTRDAACLRENSAAEETISDRTKSHDALNSRLAFSRLNENCVTGSAEGSANQASVDCRHPFSSDNKVAHDFNAPRLSLNRCSPQHIASSLTSNDNKVAASSPCDAVSCERSRDATPEPSQQHKSAEPRIANDDDYSICTEDDDDDDDSFYYTLISVCPSSRSLASEIAAAEGKLRKLSSRRSSRISAGDADSRRGSRISTTFSDDSRRGSRILTLEDDGQSQNNEDKMHLAVTAAVAPVDHDSSTDSAVVETGTTGCKRPVGSTQRFPWQPNTHI